MSLSKWAKEKDGTSKQAKAKAVVAQLPPWKKGRVKHPFPVGDRDTYKGPHSDDEVKKAISEAPMKAVPIKTLASVQHSVIPGRVAQYIDDPKLAEKAGSSPPTVVKSGGQDYLWDGNHRATSAWALGEKTIEARYADLDKLKPEAK